LKAVVTDSAANVRAAVNVLSDNVEGIPCSAHRINLWVNDLFTVVKISEKEGCFFNYDYNEFDELRKIEINIETTVKPL
jgi:hypothetical protein